MRRTRRSAGVLLVLALLAACFGEPDATRAATRSTIRIDGSNGVMPLVAALAEAWRAAGAQDSVVFGAGMGGSARIHALLDGSIDVALASHGIDVDSLAARGLTVHRVALTPVVFAVHAGVTVPRLTEAQICSAFAGRTTNWRSAGGANLPLRPVVRPESEVDMEVVRGGILCFAELPLASGVLVVEETADMAATLASTEGAIGVTTATVVQQSNGRIRALALSDVEPSPDAVSRGRYPLTRASYLVIRAGPDSGVVRFLDFIRSPQGAAVLAANGSIAAP